MNHPYFYLKNNNIYICHNNTIRWSNFFYPKSTIFTETVYARSSVKDIYLYLPTPPYGKYVAQDQF